MPRRVKPTRGEFKVGENEVVHLPTNAAWTAYPGRPEAYLYRPGSLGSVLSNGDDYREEEVEAMALRLLAERLP
jgi:hypothetical protein